MTTRESTELEELLELGDRIVHMAKAAGVSVAECVVRTGSELLTKVRLDKLELVEEAAHRSAGLRVMKGKQVATTSTSDLTEAGIRRFVSDAVELADLAQEDPFAGPADEAFIDASSIPSLDLFDPSLSSVDAQGAISWARRGEGAARAFDARITNSEGATFSRTAGGTAMVLSSGFRSFSRGSYASLSVVPVAADGDGKNRRGSYWTAKRFLADLEEAESVGQEAARRTLRKLGARTLKTTEVPVIFDPDAARALLGMFAGCVVGSSIWRKSSYLIGREGSVVASPEVSIVDDPLLPRAPGSRPYDGEGLPGRKNVVVEKGVLRSYLCDSYSARKLGRTSTGNASRGGSAGVSCGTTNFILEPGTDSPEAIIQATKQGLYVTEMMGFGFNPLTGDFSRGAAGFWIDGGQLAYPVSEVTISLNIDELYKSIDAIGSDLDLRTATAAPTFRVAKMTVAGGG